MKKYEFKKIRNILNSPTDERWALAKMDTGKNEF